MHVLTSTVVPTRMRAPDFILPDTENNIVGRTDFEELPLLVMFLCNHCPEVKRLTGALVRFAREYQDKGLGIVAINANDVNRVPEDSPEHMAKVVERKRFTFPYLFDESQQAAKAYGAACTPDFFLFDSDHRLAYHGRFDGSHLHRTEPTGADLRAAAAAVLRGKAVTAPQHPSEGCSIEWKAGNQPDFV